MLLFYKKVKKKPSFYNINTFPPLGGRKGGKNRRVERPRPKLVTFKYLILRKRYVEKLSFYKLLEELNELPEECATFPYFIDKIDDKKLQFVDFYVTFTRHYKFEEKAGELADFYHQLHINDGTAEGSFSVLFMYKSKNVRLSSQARFAFEVSFLDFELTQFCFNSKILTVSDFFRAALGESVDYTQALTKVQNSDNERFALIQT